jgi:hypothetical protein
MSWSTLVLQSNSYVSQQIMLECLAHMIQLVVKALLSTFDIKPTESEYSEDSVNGGSINNVIKKV